MGWKRFKEHFGITHIVHITDEGLCIGSRIAPALAIIDIATGRVSDNTGFLANNYPAVLAADPADRVAPLVTPDTFEEAIPVFAYDEGRIIVKKCEVPGYPNVTHDGVLMSSNVFFPEVAQAVQRARQNTAAAIDMTRQEVSRLESHLASAREDLGRFEAEMAKLDGDFPTPEHQR